MHPNSQIINELNPTTHEGTNRANHPGPAIDFRAWQQAACRGRPPRTLMTSQATETIEDDNKYCPLRAGKSYSTFILYLLKCY